MYNVKNGEQYAKITITDSETVKFSDKWDVFGVKGDDITVKLNSTDSGDGVYNTDDTGGAVVIAHGRRLDTMYLVGTGDVIVWAGASAVDCPFSKGAKGGDSGNGTHWIGTTTTAISDGSSTNPITILIEDEPVTYTAVMGDIVVYGSSEFIFDSNIWKEIGRGVDTTPTSGSANFVTSNGIYKNTAGKKYYSENRLKGEIFNSAKEASGNNSHAEGNNTYATGYASHAEGYGGVARGIASHAEGSDTTASGDYSHAEGMTTRSYGAYSHAEGITTIARGSASHAGGNSTIANTANSTAIGKFNAADGTEVSDPKHLFIIGNGTADNARSNIVEVSETDMNVNGDITRNSVPMYPLVYNPQTESFSFAGLT